MYQAVTITEPTSEPVTTAEAKDHLRVSWSDDDDYIAALIATARKIVEQRTGSRLFTQTVEVRGDTWHEMLQHRPYRYDDIISLRVTPVQSVDSVKYYDSNDVDTTYAASNYWTDLVSVPARIQIKDTAAIPTINDRMGNVRIRLTVGYATVASIPAVYKTAIKLLVAHWYENREATAAIQLKEIPEGVNNLLMGVSDLHHYDTGSM